jgi:hypothetical protein
MTEPVSTYVAEPTLEGGCLCGAIRYRATGPPRNATHCHCTICRRASGAAFVTWITVDAEGFRFTRGAPARYRSSSRATRTFCATCGTPLTFQLLADPNEVDLTVCSLERPEEIAPQDHTFARHMLPWVEMDDSLPRYPERRTEEPS